MRSHGVLHIWDDSFFVLFHVRAAFTMGEKVGVTFPSSWGAQFHAGMAVDCNVGGPSPALSTSKLFAAAAWVHVSVAPVGLGGCAWVRVSVCVRVRVNRTSAGFGACMGPRGCAWVCVGARKCPRQCPCPCRCLPQSGI